MRKNRKQQKNSQQIELFNKLMERPAESTASGTGKGITKGVELLLQLEMNISKLLETALVR
jgi:hypothetical protein